MIDFLYLALVIDRKQPLNSHQTVAVSMVVKASDALEAERLGKQSVEANDYIVITSGVNYLGDTRNMLFVITNGE